MTAVEWLLNELSIAGYFPYGIPPKIEDQAKEMEKQQIIKAYNISWKLRDKPYATAEKYYKQTFKSE